MCRDYWGLQRALLQPAQHIPIGRRHDSCSGCDSIGQLRVTDDSREVTAHRGLTQPGQQRVRPRRGVYLLSSGGPHRAESLIGFGDICSIEDEVQTLLTLEQETRVECRYAKVFLPSYGPSLMPHPRDKCKLQPHSFYGHHRHE